MPKKRHWKTFVFEDDFDYDDDDDDDDEEEEDEEDKVTPARATRAIKVISTSSAPTKTFQKLIKFMCVYLCILMCIYVCICVYLCVSVWNNDHDSVFVKVNQNNYRYWDGNTVYNYDGDDDDNYDNDDDWRLEQW